MSRKLYKTTSRFKRQFRRDVSAVLKAVRANEPNHQPRIVADLVHNTLRQRSGHYMKKSIRRCYDQIPAEHKGA